MTIEVNATGLDTDTQLVVEILDRKFRPLDGYGIGDARPMTLDGFRLPAEWSGRTTITPPDEGIRVCVRFVGARPEDGRLYTVYVRPAD